MKPKLLLPSLWTPSVPVAAIVCHWTAGTRSISSLDREHYHFIIDGIGQIHRGDRSIEDNVPPLRNYAAHSRGFNASSGKAVIGVAVCGMAGARSFPKFSPGAHPISRVQMEVMAQLVAYLCEKYDVPVTPQTVLQHGEVQKNVGKIQLGKWDVCRWPWAPELTSEQVCSAFRGEVNANLKPKSSAKRLCVGFKGKGTMEVADAVLREGTWFVDGQKLAAALARFSGKSFPMTGVAPLRSHLPQHGLAVDESATALSPKLPDGNSLVYIKAVEK